MANSIEKAKRYAPLLDEVFKQGSLTAILDAPAEWVREGANASEILIPSVVVDGLGDYSRSNGYTAGDVDFSWQTHAFTQDRGRKFNIDAQDDKEALDLAVSATIGQFVRTQVTPEVDAYRFAVLSAKTPSGNLVHADLTKDTALQAIDDGFEAIGDAEAIENCVIFVSHKVKKFLKQSNLITRQFVVNAGPLIINREIEVLDGKPIITVPKNRFYTGITLLDGVTAGQEAGGYTQTTGGTSYEINFQIVNLASAKGVKKTDLPRVFDPETNQSANAWLFDYRLYHDLFVPDNKKAGLYTHTVATALA